MGENASQAPRLDTQLFRDVFNASAIGIAVENLEGQPLFVNPAFCSMLGFSEEELCKKHFVDFSPPEDAAKDWALFQQLRAGAIDRYQLEKRYFRRDGSLVWGSLSISLLNTSPSPLVVAMVEDITEKKRAEEARFRHAAIVESSEDAIASAALDGVILSWNAGAQRIYGYTEMEAVGKSVTILVPPELADEEKKILETLKAGGRINQLETVRVTKTGKRVDVSLSVSPIKDSTGEIVGCSGIARDMTERKRAEAAVRESEERLRLAVQAGRMFAYSWDATTDFIERSGESAEILGVKQDQVATGAAISAMVHPDDKQRLEAALANLTAENPTLQITYRIIRPDGTVAWLERNSRAYFAEKGKIRRIVGIIADVTERKHAEAVLRESEERFRLAAQAGKMYAYDWNAKTNEVVRSPEYVAILGLMKPEPLSDEQFLNGIHPDDRARFLAEIGALTPEKPDRDITYRFLSPRGTVVWLRSSGHALFDGDGKVQKVVGMVTDVTEQKLSEDRLREYEKAVESAEEMIAVVDREYRFLIANRIYLKMRSMTRQQVVGRFAHEVINRGVFEAVVKEKLDECFQGKVVRYETKYVYPEIGERDVFVSYFPIEGTSGIDRVVCIARDITEQKQAEQALSSISRKLIEAQEQERARIARELHDDIGQRLALMSVKLDQIEQEVSTQPQNVQNRFRDLRTHTSDLARDVQALSHTLHTSKVEMLGLVAAMRSTCREFGEHRKMEINFSSHDLRSPVPAETSLCLIRVLQEALQNSAKHSGVKRVEVQLVEHSNEVHLIVRDLGSGFDIEAAKRGSGLGLTSMQERLKLVSGQLSIESRPHEGTTIHARVPHSPKVKSAVADEQT